MKKAYDVVVIGGASIDMYGITDDALRLGDSNPGTIHETFGGVGRNIAESLSRLGLHTLLVTVLGEDEAADRLMKSLQEAGVETHVERKGRTAKYMAWFSQGDTFSGGIADMDNIEALDIECIGRVDAAIESAKMLVVDTNLSRTVLQHLCDQYRTQTMVADSISTSKAIRLRPLLRHIDILKTNREEAYALMDKPLDTDVHDVTRELCLAGVKDVYLTQGKDAIAWRRKGAYGSIRPLTTEVVNPSGAGDAFLAGVCYASIRGHDPMVYGAAAAALALASRDPVPSWLTEETLHQKAAVMKRSLSK